MKKVLITGAGLGGLTAASLLLKAGFDVEVYEQAKVLKEAGAGIQLAANAMRVMRELGLEEELLRVGVRAKGYQFRLFDSGEVLHEFPLLDVHEKQHGAPFVQIHRADLQRALLENLRARKPDAVHLGKKTIGFSETPHGVTLHFADGTSATGDVLVGADGVKSAISKQIIGGFKTEYTGITAWRLIVPKAAIPEALRLDEYTSIFIGKGIHAIAYYLRGGELLNFCGEVPVAEASEETWTRKASWNELNADFEGWHPTIRAIIEAGPRNEVYRWSLFSRMPVRNWSTQRATLLGDAAHPALPFMAQGAGMAMEDAVILTRSLQSTEDTALALNRYQRTRIPRTTHATERTEANRATFTLTTEAEIRKAYVRHDEGKDRSAWLYSYNAFEAPLADLFDGVTVESLTSDRRG